MKCLKAITIVTLALALNKPAFSLDLCKLKEDLQVTEYEYRNETWQTCNDCQKRKLCIRKCCAVGFHASKKLCVRDKDPQAKTEFPIYKGKKFVRNAQFNDEDGIIVGITGCTFYPLLPSRGSLEEFFIQEDGSFFYPQDDPPSYGNDRYCVDYTEKGIFALLCLPDDFEFEDSIEEIIFDKIHIAGMIISLPFLLATFIVYALLPKKTILMKALMGYVFNLMFAYLFLIILKFNPEDIHCTAIGYCCLFFLPASFYWMNAICIDTWYSFCGFRNGRFKVTEKTRFLIYCGYACGMAIIHFSIIVGINENHPPSEWYHPGIGYGQCFLRAHDPELIYLYGPVGVLIAINIVLYIITALKVWYIQNNISTHIQAGLRDPTTENDKQTFILYLQLVFAMGLNWALEIISWAINWKVGAVPSYVWYFTDFLNATYGVFIFFIFVFKKNVWKLLVKRYKSCRGLDEDDEHNNTMSVFPEIRNGQHHSDEKPPQILPTV